MKYELSELSNKAKQCKYEQYPLTSASNEKPIQAAVIDPSSSHGWNILARVFALIDGGDLGVVAVDGRRLRPLQVGGQLVQPKTQLALERRIGGLCGENKNGCLANLSCSKLSAHIKKKMRKAHDLLAVHFNV